MNKTLKWGAVLMLSLATVAAPAMAADLGRPGHRGPDRHATQRHDRRDNALHRKVYAQAARHDRRHAPPPVAHHRPVVHHRPAVRHVVHRPAPHHHPGPRWARGGYVHHYRQPVYVVHDYHVHGLHHPPHGYRWYRDDYGDFLLVAVATGLIVDLILHH